MMKVSKKQRRALRALGKLPAPRKAKEHVFRITKAMERERQSPHTARTRVPRVPRRFR